MKLTLCLNHLCNLRCTYCYTGQKFDRAMAFDTARAGIELGLGLAQQGWLLLAFFGGEPLLELDLMERSLAFAAERCAQKKVRLFATIATNGTLITPRSLELFRQYRFQVQLSLDGGQPAQDANRRYAQGRSSFDDARRGLASLLESGLEPWVVSVVDPSNAALLPESFEALAELGVRRMQFAPNYRADWSQSARAVVERAVSELADRYLALARAGRDVRLDPLVGKIVAHLSPAAVERAVCKLGVGDLAVAPSGRLYPCERMVREDDDEALCIGHVTSGLDRPRRDRLLADQRRADPRCHGCPIRERCSRACGCTNVETSGELGRVSDLFCWFEQAFVAQADRIGNTLYAEQNPLFMRRFYGVQAPSA